MKYNFKMENGDPKQLLINIFNRLGECEVKGDSVGHMHISRMAIKELVESMEAIEEEKEQEG